LNYRSRWEDFDNEKIRGNTTGNSTTNNIACGEEHEEYWQCDIPKLTKFIAHHVANARKLV
jgi:hypothetical protein